MTKKWFYGVVLILLVLACSNSMIEKGWKIIHSKGIQGDNATFDYLLFDSNISALLFGSEFTDDNLINKNFKDFNAIVYSSKDSGNSWTKKVLGKGEFTSYAEKENNVFIALKKIPAGDQSNDSDSTLIYYSDNFGDSWKKICTFEGFYIRNIFCPSEKELYVIGKKESETYWTILLSANGGASWNKIGDLPKDMYSPIMTNGHLFYLAHRDSSAINIYSFSDSSVGKINVADQNFKTYLLSLVNGSLYLSGKSGMRTLIYKVQFGNNQLNLVSTLDEDKFPVGFFVTDKKLFLLLGERNSIGVAYYLYSKEDKARMWKINPIPSPYFKPFCFTGKFIWGYSYDGKFYEMTLTEE